MNNETQKTGKEVIPIDMSTVKDIACGLTDVDIEELKIKCENLKINGVNDKEGFNLVYKQHQIAKAHVSNVNKKHEFAKARVNEAGKRFDAEKNRLLDMLKPISKGLQAKRDFIEEENKLIAAEKQKAKEDRHEAQLKQVRDAGAVFNGSAYVYGEHQITDNEIWNFDENEMSAELIHITKWKTAVDAEKKETARLKKIEDDKQTEIAENNRKEEKRLAKIKTDQEAENKRIKDENKRIADEKLKSEMKERELSAISFFISLGFIACDGGNFDHENNSFVEKHHYSMLTCDEDLQKLKNTLQKLHDRKVEEKEKKEEQEKLVAEKKEKKRRHDLLLGLGLHKTLDDHYCYGKLSLGLEILNFEIEEFETYFKQLKTDISALKEKEEKSRKEQIEKDEKDVARRKFSAIECLVSFGYISCDLGYENTEYNHIIGYFNYSTLTSDEELKIFTDNVKSAVKREKKRAEELELSKKKATEDAEKKAKEDIERKEKEKLATEEKAEKAAIAKEKRRPDKEKLLNFLNEIKAIGCPVVKTEAAVIALGIIECDLGVLLNSHYEAIEKL